MQGSYKDLHIFLQTIAQHKKGTNKATIAYFSAQRSLDNLSVNRNISDSGIVTVEHTDSSNKA
jgi:predicted transcriptional regulator